MNKTTVVKAFKGARRILVKRSPEILMGIGIASAFTSTVLAVKATPKAIELMEKRKAELEVEKLPGVEIVKTTWKCYIPAAASGVTAVACLIGSSSVNASRNAALATAYKLSETALSEYRDKVIETIGEEKEKTVLEKVTEERVKNDPVTNKEVLVTGHGTSLCYDSHFGRYFEYDMDAIKRAENEINRQLVTDMYASLNDFYSLVGLEHVDAGDQLGWNLDDGLVEIYYSSHLATDGRPCLAINYTKPPKYGYYNFI